MSETLLIARAIAILVLVFGGLGWGSFALVRWVRRTGRRPWIWLLGTYVALTIVWSMVSGFLR